MPRAAPYCGNKRALHGFFDTLRQDLAIQGQRDITITLHVLGYIDIENTVQEQKVLQFMTVLNASLSMNVLLL